jgi:hypothetical protein
MARENRRPLKNLLMWGLGFVEEGDGDEDESFLEWTP